jgi:hypothetical protein
MNVLSVIGVVPAVAVVVADRVTKASRELAAAARLGTELIRSPSIGMFRFQPSLVAFGVVLRHHIHRLGVSGWDERDQP